jgi:two-component system cell cycle sensor histidine kinase/response regulator CckA
MTRKPTYKDLEQRIRVVEEESIKGKRAEEELRESENKYRDLYDFLPISFVEIDTKGTIISFNRKSLEVFRYKQEDFKDGMTALQFFESSQLERLGVNLQRVIDGTSIPGQEFLFLRKDGSTFPGLIFTSTIIQANKIVGIRAAIIDITEREQAEEALRTSEEKYRWVIDNMADVITVMDMNLRFTYVSPSIMRMRGYTAEEATAQTFEQAMTPESLQISAMVFEEEMKLEASGTADPSRIRIVELEQYRKDGSIVLMENSLSFIRDKAQKPVGIISVSRDITERKRAEAQLKESEERYRTILDEMEEGYQEVDLAGNFTFLNEAFLRIFGYSKDELMGTNFSLYAAEKETAKKVYSAYCQRRHENVFTSAA